MSPTTEVTAGFLCGARAEGVDLRVTRQELVVTDHGTGTGRATVTRLTVTAAEADRLAPRGPTTRAVPPVHLDLHPVDGDPSRVDVMETGGPGGGRRARPRRVRLAEHLLARFTHDRLDPGADQPTVHAGAAAADTGRTVLVLGPSGSGKSTLVAHLVDRGLDLVNDEQVTLHPRHGLVAGFTRPIAVKRGGVAHLPASARTGVTDGEFGALVTAAQLGGRHRLVGPPGLLVVPERSPAGGVSWEELSPGQAVEVLCANNLDLVAKPTAGMAAFAWLASAVPTVRLHYADASSAAGELASLLARPSPRHSSWTIWSGAAGPAAPGSAAEADGGRAARVPHAPVVSVAIGDEVVAFHPPSRGVVRLDGAAAAVWRRLPQRVDHDGADPLLAELADLGFVE